MKTKGMREIEKETRHFEYNYFYPITITKTDNYYEATLNRKEYGICMKMFGCECNSWEEMIEMVESNVEDYIITLWEKIIEDEREEADQ